MSIKITQTDVSFEVEIDHNDLADELSMYLEPFIRETVEEVVSENINSHIDDYVRYNLDLTSAIQECIDIEQEITDLLTNVTSRSLCPTGDSFRGAIVTILENHVNLYSVLESSLNNEGKKLAINLETVNIFQPAESASMPVVDAAIDVVVGATQNETSDIPSVII
jgi:hypothetical protein